jgi:hypothetical protein
LRLWVFRFYLVARFRCSLGMTFLRYFIYIVVGALVSSALGGIFACTVAWISPEFVASLFGPAVNHSHGSLFNYATAVGMIWGLFLGTVVMAFSLLLVTFIQVARIIRKKSDELRPTN